jgi:predicted nucleic acid-binding Zn ribbon protein
MNRHRGRTLSTGRAGIVQNPMPTYVYKFVKTGETIEVQQSFKEDTLTSVVHPRSGRKMAVKKVFTPVGVTFRGDGFYKTDSRSKPSKSTSKTEGTGEAATTKSSDSPSETKTPSASESSKGSSKKSDSKAAAAP